VSLYISCRRLYTVSVPGLLHLVSDVVCKHFHARVGSSAPPRPLPQNGYKVTVPPPLCPRCHNAATPQRAVAGECRRSPRTQKTQHKRGRRYSPPYVQPTGRSPMWRCVREGACGGGAAPTPATQARNSTSSRDDGPPPKSQLGWMPTGAQARGSRSSERLAPLRRPGRATAFTIAARSGGVPRWDTQHPPPTPPYPNRHRQRQRRLRVMPPTAAAPWPPAAAAACPAPTRRGRRRGHWPAR